MGLTKDQAAERLREDLEWLDDDKRRALDKLSDVVNAAASNDGPAADESHGNSSKDVQGIKDKLSVASTAKLLDPASSQAFDFESVPPPGKPTTEAHRLTMSLPNSDHTSLSLGAKDSGHLDTGIRGQTDQHVHFEVRGGEEIWRTFVSLGVPVNEPAVKSELSPNAPKQVHGYGMFTHGAAWQESRWKHTIHSARGDVAITTAGEDMHAVLHATAGKVSVAGKNDVTVATAHNLWMGADIAGTVEKDEFDKAFEGKVGKWAANKVAKTAVTMIEFFQSMQQLALKLSDYVDAPKDGENSWSRQPVASKVKTAVDTAKLISTFARFVHEFDAPGKAAVFATTYASMTGDIAASVYGNASATLASVLSASVVGGTASLKGLAWASVFSGIQTSIKSMRDVEIKADAGTLKARGHKSAELSAADGNLKLAAKTDAQLCADKVAFINGTTDAIVTAGKGAGYGARFQKDKAVIGTMSRVDSLAEANAAPIQHLTMVRDDYVELQAKDTSLKMAKDRCELIRKHKGVSIRDDGTYVDGEKVFVG
jgi:hypothetical protein